MDNVVIHKGGRIVLAILLTTYDLQLMFLRERNTASSMTEIFQDLRRTLGGTYFRILFQVIVTDHESESIDPVRIETDPETRTVQYRVFYCGPINDSQKSDYKRDHELIQYVVPENQAREHYMEEETREMMNRINSYPRKKRNGQAPIDFFVRTYSQETIELPSPRKTPSDSIHLIPTLLKK